MIAAHRHRNEAYHEWHVGDRFIRPLCFLYFDFACSYLERFQVGFLSWYGNYQYSDVARKYERAARAEDGPLGGLDRIALANALRKELPKVSEIGFQDALADDLQEDRHQLARSYRFLIDNSPPTEKAEYLLAKAQFDFMRDRALAKNGLDDTNFGSPRRGEAAQYVKTRFRDFMPRYRAIPHGSWSQSISRVRETSDPMAAFSRFQKVRDSMSFLLNAITESAMRLEADLDRD